MREAGEALWLIVRRSSAGRRCAAIGSAGPATPISRCFKPELGEIARLRVTSGLGEHIW